MDWGRWKTIAALLTLGGLLLGGVPVGAQTGGTPPPGPATPTPTRPPASPTATPIPPTPVPTLPPVANSDPRFGAVQAIFGPQAAAAAGVKWERLIFPWNEIQPNGPTDFEQGWFTEEQINGEIARGIQVVGITLYTPSWAARDPQQEARSVPRNLNLSIDDPQNYWAAYVKRLVAKYRGRIDTWVILNEPDIYKDPDDFRTFAGTPADYAQVLKTAYRAAKSVNPNATIVMSGFTYWWDHEARRPQYFQRVLDAIGGDPTAAANNWFFDAVDSHTYGNPLNGYNIPTTFRRIMQDKGLNKPIWITETNVLVKDDPKTPTNDPTFRATMDEQASYVIQNMSLAIAAGVQRYSIYKMNDEAAEVGDQYWGLVHDDGTPRPSYVAYQTGVKYFQGVRNAYYYWWGAGMPPSDQEMTGQLASNANRFQWPWPGAVNVVVMDKGQQRVTVLWNASPQAGTVALPAYSRAATLVDKYGHEQPLTATNGYYQLTLEQSRNNSDPRDRTLYLVGGNPWIVVEDMTQAIMPAPTQTFTPTLTPTATSTPPATATLLPGQTPPPTAATTATPARTPTPAPTAGSTNTPAATTTLAPFPPAPTATPPSPTATLVAPGVALPAPVPTVAGSRGVPPSVEEGVPPAAPADDEPPEPASE
jgi:hypothetical protein